LIREATAEDAEQFCDVLRTSITELCYLDHRGDKKLLDEWLENKTVQNCKEWIVNPGTNAFVAETNGKIVGVSTIGHDGFVFLCYVIPKFKGQGVGGQLLKSAEASVLKMGVHSFKLESTITAKEFYEHHGYLKVGKSTNCLEYEKISNNNKEDLHG
jgi:GNAT superfamily N-acetyltransferase